VNACLPRDLPWRPKARPPIGWQLAPEATEKEVHEPPARRRASLAAEFASHGDRLSQREHSECDLRRIALVDRPGRGLLLEQGVQETDDPSIRGEHALGVGVEQAKTNEGESPDDFALTLAGRMGEGPETGEEPIEGIGLAFDCLLEQSFVELGRHLQDGDDDVVLVANVLVEAAGDSLGRSATC